MKDLSGMRVLVTGAAGGMGREYARQLLDLGCSLILTDLDGERLAAVTREILEAQARPTGAIAGLIEADITQPDGCRGIYEKTIELAGGADMLINNAGVIAYGDFHELPQERWEALMQVNLLAPMRLTFLFLPGMIRQGRGHLVFMSSVAGFIPTAHGAAYSCSKFGLRGLGMALSGEVKDKGIQVTNVYPWWVATDMLRSPEYGSASIGRLPLPGIMTDRPGKVVREVIRGIRRNRLHVYPGPFAKGSWIASKVYPLISKQAH